MRNNVKISKLFFILSAFVLVLYFFSSFPYGFNNSLNAISGNWCEPNIIDDDANNNPQYYNGNNGLIVENETILIYNAYQLGYVAYKINNNDNYYANKNVKLMNNIDLGAHYWTPIKKFIKTFDGQGYTISNMCIKYNADSTPYNDDNDNRDENIAFISWLCDGEVVNVNFNKVSFDSGCFPHESCGVMSAHCDNSTISNCTVRNTSSNLVVNFGYSRNSSDFYYGGMAGRTWGSTIKGCIVELNISFESLMKNDNEKYNLMRIGGIVGEARNGTTIQYCSSSGSLSKIYGSKEVRLGGIVGELVRIASDECSIFGCGNYANLTAGYAGTTKIEMASVGGIAGWTADSSKIEYSFNMGDIEAYVKFYTNKQPQGIGPGLENQMPMGEVTSDFDFDKTLDTNKKYYYSGGYIESKYLRLLCSSNGVIDYSVGENVFKKAGTYKNSINKPNRLEQGYKNYIGGIVGYNYSSNVKLFECYNSGEIGILNKDNYYIERMSNLYIYEVYLDDTPILKRNYKAYYFREIPINITYKDSTASALIGYENSADIKNCYYDKNINKIKEFTYTINNKKNNLTNTIENYGSDRIQTDFSVAQIAAGENILIFAEIYSYKIILGKSNKNVYVDVYYTSTNTYTPVHAMTLEESSKGEYVADISTLINNRKLDGNIWATDSTTNDGYPYIKEMYWKEDAITAPGYNFEYTTSGSNATITKINVEGDVKIIEVPNEFMNNNGTYTVTAIGTSAFEGKTTITDVKLPNTITTFGKEAFRGCSSLKNINMPRELTTFGIGAFRGCTSLNEISLPSGVTLISESCFYGCSELKRINLGNITSIGYCSFYNCEQLNNLTFSKNLTFISGYAFRYNKSLTSINLSHCSNFNFKPGTNYTRHSIFEGCIKLETVKLPNSVTIILKNQFKDCTSLKSITLSDSLQIIDDSSFENCKLLKLTLLNNSSIKTIGNKAFKGCTSLTRITLGQGITSMGESVFEECSSLISINLPIFVNEIKNKTFYGCHNLTQIGYYKGQTYVSNVLPDNIVAIGEYAFFGCQKIETLTIYDTLTSIGLSSFCFALNNKVITYKGTIEQWKKLNDSNVAQLYNTTIKCSDGTYIDNP